MKKESYEGCLKHLAFQGEPKRRFPLDPSVFPSVNPFITDQCSIVCSKASRRLEDKTHVVTAPRTGLMRDRNSHTMEVMSAGVQIASVLGLNVELTGAIALGHDIGHVPFGHVGEDFLGKDGRGNKFSHSVFGCVLAQKIERKGEGLNLCKPVLIGMFNHSRRSGSFRPTDGVPQEATAAMYADKTYIFSDYNDFMKRFDFPQSWKDKLSEPMAAFGNNQRERVATYLKHLFMESEEQGKVSFVHSPYAKMFEELKKLMYEIYPKVNVQCWEPQLTRVLELLEKIFGENAKLAFCMMTDNDVLSLVNKNVFDVSDLMRTSMWELKDTIDQSQVNIYDPDLNW